jgi:ABC-type transport system substrate-binding protein
VRLRTDLQWSDGTPVTAHDVAFTFGAIKSLGANRLGGNFASFAPEDLLVRVEAIDDHTVEFVLSRRDARYKFDVLLAPIFNRAFWQPRVESAVKASDPLNAIFQVDIAAEPTFGPYAYGTWERGSFVNRPANPRYSQRGAVERHYANGAVRLERADGRLDWSGYGPAEGEPVLEVVKGPGPEAVNYRIYGTQATGVLALQAGEVDLLINPLGLEKGFQDQIRGAPGVTLVQNPSSGVRYLSFNLRREPMGRLAFRQAIATLIDREFITGRVLQGVADPLYNIVPPANTFWYNPNVPVYGAGLSRGERMREAVRLLEADGFAWEQKPEVNAAGEIVRAGRGLRLPDGQPLRDLELLGPGDAYDPLRATFASWIERWLNEAGIPIKPNLTAFNVVSERVFERQDFDLWILGWSLSPYPSYLNGMFHSRYTGLNGHNAQGYANPEYDRMVEAFLEEADDLDKARTLAHQLQEFLARDLPYIILFDTPIVEAYRSDHLRFPTTRGIGGIQNQLLPGGGSRSFLSSVQTMR